MSSFGKGKFGSGLEINTQVVNGKCPFCTAESIFISIHNTIFRCITCGSDLEQKVNGKISYIPHVEDAKTFRYNMKIDNPNG